MASVSTLGPATLHRAIAGTTECVLTTTLAAKTDCSH